MKFIRISLVFLLVISSYLIGFNTNMIRLWVLKDKGVIAWELNQFARYTEKRHPPLSVILYSISGAIYSDDEYRLSQLLYEYSVLREKEISQMDSMVTVRMKGE